MARHVHADKMIEAAEDNSIKWQTRRSNEDRWQDVQPCWDPGQEYRKKPREFQEGHWYPCSYGGDKMVCVFDGHKFMQTVTNEFINKFGVTELSWIGESLGELKFGK